MTAQTETPDNVHHLRIHELVPVWLGLFLHCPGDHTSVPVEVLRHPPKLFLKLKHQLRGSNILLGNPSPLCFQVPSVSSSFRPSGTTSQLGSRRRHAIASALDNLFPKSSAWRKRCSSELRRLSSDILRLMPGCGRRWARPPHCCLGTRQAPVDLVRLPDKDGSASGAASAQAFGRWVRELDATIGWRQGPAFRGSRAPRGGVPG